MSKKRSNNFNYLDKEDIKFFYGIPHCHSTYSTGKGIPLTLYEYASKIGLHFLFLSDHNNYLNNTTTYKDKKVSKWQATFMQYSKCKKSTSNFIPLVGFECKTSCYGDLNIINPKTFFTGHVKDLSLLTLWMLNNENSFVSINHPHKEILNIPFDENYNKVITCIEVTNGNPAAKITHHEKYYFKLLDKGWKLGAINGQDNHRINFSDSENLTVFISNELSIPSLINAFREHRTYSTESRFLKFYFTINNAFMGETLNLSSNELNFFIFAEDIKNKILDIEILSNNGSLVQKIENINLNTIKYILKYELKNNETWFVVKIIQENKKTALSSPIFINNPL